jgi:hypothetical protein
MAASGSGAEAAGGGRQQELAERRMLRSRYLAVKSLISGTPPLPFPISLRGFRFLVIGCGAVLTFFFVACVRDADEKDDMAKEDSDKFAAIITQVECLHELGTATNHHLLLLQPAVIFLCQRRTVVDSFRTRGKNSLQSHVS